MVTTNFLIVSIELSDFLWHKFLPHLSDLLKLAFRVCFLKVNRKLCDTLFNFFNYCSTSIFILLVYVVFSSILNFEL